VAAAIWYRLDDEGEDRFGLHREDGSLKPAGERLREHTGPWRARGPFLASGAQYVVFA